MDAGGDARLNLMMNIAKTKETFRVYTKANEHVSLAISSDGKVVLATADDGDLQQHWYKFNPCCTELKDKDGFPGFILVNKSTSQAIKHPEENNPLDLADWDRETMSPSDGQLLPLIWTWADILEDGFRAIRMVNDTYLNFTAGKHTENDGDVDAGTKVYVAEWYHTANPQQRWMITEYN